MKGTTVDDVLDPLFVGCTMTCVAVIVVLSVVPSTRAVLPLVTALADAEFVPFSYVVDDVSLTVTFAPAAVNTPKPDLDTLLTLPMDPPAAGPDRALDAVPPNPEGAPCAAVVEPASAIATPPIARPISAAPAAINVVSLCLRKILRLRVSEPLERARAC